MGRSAEMRVYHFLDAKYGLENIANRRLKVSLFDSVNDPFELFCHSLGDEELRRRMGKFRNTTAAGSGMICFSKSMSSPVQWAHYADRHRGVCLGFDIPETFLEHVQYVPERLDFRANEPWAVGSNDPRAQECFVTKFEHWSYEQEVRLFGSLGAPHPESGLHFSSFNENLQLKEVYVGCASKISKSELDESLADLAQQVACFKVRPAFTSFKMVKDLSVGWDHSPQKQSMSSE
jgi:hypothetical protein